MGAVEPATPAGTDIQRSSADLRNPSQSPVRAVFGSPSYGPLYDCSVNQAKSACNSNHGEQTVTEINIEPSCVILTIVFATLFSEKTNRQPLDP